MRHSTWDSRPRPDVSASSARRNAANTRDSHTPTCCSRALSRADRSGSICSRVESGEREAEFASSYTTYRPRFPSAIHPCTVYITHLLWFAPASVVSGTCSSSAGKASFAVGGRFRRQEESGPTNFFSSFAPAAHPTMHRHFKETSLTNTTQLWCWESGSRQQKEAKGDNSKTVHAGAVTC